jgi:AcrR family transcriptional regulator
MKTRKYELKKRAERREQTRRRIVEATIALHAELGPGRTSISAIAERAGVQRHTVYAHFPQERDLHFACSGLHLERYPLPDPDGWLEEPDPERRLRRGLSELYAYYAEHEQLIGNAFRDIDAFDFTREVMEVRFGPTMARAAEVLSGCVRARGRRRERVLAAARLASSFAAWRSLVRESGLPPAEAVEAAVGMIRCQ